MAYDNTWSLDRASFFTTQAIDAVKNSTPPALAADGEGFDTTAITQGKQGCVPEVEAKAEAFLANLPSDLVALITAWDTLPDAVKAGIMAMVQAVKLTPQ